MLLLLRSERLLSRSLLLLLRDGGLQFGNCALLFCDVPVFFQELVKQHRVHRLIANGHDFAVLAPNH